MERVELAETTPLMACRGPLTAVLMVNPFVEMPVVEAYGKTEAAVVVAVKYPAKALMPKSDEPLTERARQGVVVPTPSQPALVMVVVPVPPNQA